MMIEKNLFLKDLWYKLEPFVNELITYSFVILAFEIVRRWIDIFIDPKIKETIEILKMILLIGTLSLFVFHALMSLLVRVIASIWDSGKNTYHKIKENKDPDSNALNPMPAASSEINSIKKHKEKVNKKEEE